MDLLGRKTKRKLEDYAVLAQQYVKLLQAKNWDANNRIRLITIENANLKDQLESVSQELKDFKEKFEPKLRPVSSVPLYLNESEEDIEYAFRNELIDKDQYEDMLKQLEFDNTEITFDLERY